MQNRLGDETFFFGPEFDDRLIAPNGDVMDAVRCARIGGEESDVATSAIGGLSLRPVLL